MNTQKILSEYQKNTPLYEEYAKKLSALLKEILVSKNIEHVMEFRVKNIDSFEKKISREGKSYIDPLKEITDIWGVRIITSRTSFVEEIINIIKKELKVDTENSIIKFAELNVDQFGYLSSHLVVLLDGSRSALTEWVNFVDLKAEIQIRTQLQHAWAQVSHKFNYKTSADIPSKLQRKLFRLSALFELADEELEAISSGMEELYNNYLSHIECGVITEEMNIDSLRAYIEKSDIVRYWQNIIRNEPQHAVESWGDLSRDIRIAHFIGLSKISEIDHLLKEAKGWGEAFFKKYYQKHFEENGNRKGSTVLNGVVTWLMIATYIDKFPKDVLEKEFGIHGLASYYIAELMKKGFA